MLYSEGRGFVRIVLMMMGESHSQMTSEKQLSFIQLTKNVKSGDFESLDTSEFFFIFYDWILI